MTQKLNAYIFHNQLIKIDKHSLLLYIYFTHHPLGTPHPVSLFRLKPNTNYFTYQNKILPLLYTN